eukprot:CAMPEP_0202736376 /NCGR_PEP_ID=MMETSP1388-20130828/972_1 /ASSEMBLY_ACC=CAM_ASM_000864 /TAXON_ID=37098 /ORGANISM="Isochrysis sp, Strain CCMP1244" /LENGTH=104 /DNA_ID=CAMNT_0049402883 /DNA_START=256 /DNA_END=570 /DNA_ORIENTATION=+
MFEVALLRRRSVASEGGEDQRGRVRGRARTAAAWRGWEVAPQRQQARAPPRQLAEASAGCDTSGEVTARAAAARAAAAWARRPVRRRSAGSTEGADTRSLQRYL